MYNILSFENISSNDKILYIPIACDFTTYENCFDWFYSLASKYLNISKNNIHMLLDYDAVPNFFDYKAIYIGGGNTYKLLDYIVKNNLKDKFQDYLKNNGLVFGGSAGAIVFGSTIETVLEEKEAYPDNSALSFIKEYALRCHYKNNEDNLFMELSSSLPTPIIAIPENGGMIIDTKKNTIKIIGDLCVFIKGKKNSISVLEEKYAKF